MMLVAGLGYPHLCDTSLDPVLIERLQRNNWPQGGSLPNSVMVPSVCDRPLTTARHMNASLETVARGCRDHQADRRFERLHQCFPPCIEAAWARCRSDRTCSGTTYPGAICPNTAPSGRPW